VDKSARSKHDPQPGYSSLSLTHELLGKKKEALFLSFCGSFGQKINLSQTVWLRQMLGTSSSFHARACSQPNAFETTTDIYNDVIFDLLGALGKSVYVSGNQRASL
jgi:hypothetical protein